MKICLHAIVKNEETILERCLTAAQPFVAGYHLCDTGSSDATLEIIERFRLRSGLPVKLERLAFEDFQTTRNQALQLCREWAADFDYLLLCDADMELRSQGPLPPLDQDHYLVEQRAGDFRYWNSRLLRPNTPGEYRGYTHEVFHSSQSAQRYGGFYFVDHADGGGRGDKFERDERLLRRQIEEDPKDPRAWFYLAQTLKDLGRYEEAIETYQHRINLSGWAEEIWYSRLQQARCAQALDQLDRAVTLYWRAYEDRPERAESLYALARMLRSRHLPEAACGALDLCLDLAYPSQDILFIEGGLYPWDVLEEYSLAGYYCRLPRRRQMAKELNQHLAHEAPIEPARVARARSHARLFLHFLEREGKARCWKLPQADWTDYVPMNPTLVWHQGRLLCNIRHVNYRLEEGHFHLPDGEKCFRTRNWLGSLDDRGEFSPLFEVPIPPPLFSEFTVHGAEDCRLFSFQDRLWFLANSRDQAAHGRCRSCLGEIDLQGHLLSYQVLDPGQLDHHKNWTPLVRDQQALAVIWTEPWQALPLDLQQPQAVPVLSVDQPQAGVASRGGSQWIPWRNGFLSVVHQVLPGDQRLYVHRFVWVSHDFQSRLVSYPFVFQAAGVEYCCGLSPGFRPGQFWLAYGRDDREAWLAEMSEQEIAKFFQNGPSEN